MTIRLFDVENNSENRNNLTKFVNQGQPGTLVHMDKNPDLEAVQNRIEDTNTQVLVSQNPICPGDTVEFFGKWRHFLSLATG